MVKIYNTEIPRIVNRSQLSKSLQSCEVEILASMEHENIIKYYGYFIDENRLCVVLEACDKSLAEVISGHYERNSIISQKLVMKWFKQLVSGIKYLHSKKCHHRDIKPEYILAHYLNF